MVKGLDLFRAYFADYANQYVLIGGTACTLAMEKVGLAFRATKDLDIVLCVEVLDVAFVQAFWDFLRAGKYNNLQKSTGKKLYYRFQNPEDQNFPLMLELFSRVPDALAIKDDSHLTPIPVNEDASSLSAILLDDDYYRFIHEGKREFDGLPAVGPIHLIPLKAKAWLDLTARQKAGDKIDEKDLRKHKNDVFRLYQIISPDDSIKLPVSIEEDLKKFLRHFEQEANIDLRSLGLQHTSLQEVLSNIKSIYGV